jgi:hypothetical protein
MGLLRETSLAVGTKKPITVHQLNAEKLDDILGYKQKAGELDPGRSSYVEKMQFNQERKDRMLQGKPVGTMEEEHALQASRPVLQLEKPLAVNVRPGLSLGPAGQSLQTRYVEQWINDVLRDAEGLKFKGIVTQPEK